MFSGVDCGVQLKIRHTNLSIPLISNLVLTSHDASHVCVHLYLFLMSGKAGVLFVPHILFAHVVVGNVPKMLPNAI